jgi:hypothetical protein
VHPSRHPCVCGGIDAQGKCGQPGEPPSLCALTSLKPSQECNTRVAAIPMRGEFPWLLPEVGSCNDRHPCTCGIACWRAKRDRNRKPPSLCPRNYTKSDRPPEKSARHPCACEISDAVPALDRHPCASVENAKQYRHPYVVSPGIRDDREKASKDRKGTAAIPVSVYPCESGAPAPSSPKSSPPPPPSLRVRVYPVDRGGLSYHPTVIPAVRSHRRLAISIWTVAAVIHVCAGLPVDLFRVARPSSLCASSYYSFRET